MVQIDFETNLDSYFECITDENNFITISITNDTSDSNSSTVWCNNLKPVSLYEIYLPDGCNSSVDSFKTGITTKEISNLRKKCI